jgi:hypothetical protein
VSERHDIWAVADALQMDLRAASAKLVELRARLSGLDLPNPAKLKCPHCELETRGERTLAEHIRNLHDGPVPAHYSDIESRSLDPEEPEEDE